MSDIEELFYRVSPSEAKQRLDIFVQSHTPDWVSRNIIKNAINEEKVLVDSNTKKPSYKVKEGEVITLIIPAPEPSTVEPEDIPLDVIYEDSSIIVVNKSPDMIVHPVPHKNTGTLVNALLYRCKDLKGIGNEVRPGIVHRLDNDTSGAIIAAKTEKALTILSKQFHDKKNKKQYLALLHGILRPEKGKIEKALGRNPKNRLKMTVDDSGKEALTYFKVLKRFSDKATLVWVEIKTGRTHQIRVHFKSISFPVFGDELYGYPTEDSEFGAQRQMLHAAKLGIFHPETGKWMEFIARVPEDFKKVLRNLSDKKPRQ